MRDFPSRGSSKRLRSSKTEIIDLPNSIIQHILKFLLVKEAIQFCTLSRQWNSLWKSIANLSFHCESTEWEEVSRFASFVDKVLMLYASPKIKKFSLKFAYYDDLKEQAASWHHFATCHEVEQLSLDITHQDYTMLPPFLFPNSPVTELTLVSFLVDLEGRLRSISWTSLKILCLIKTRIDGDSIRTILLRSPSLDSLTLQECFRFNGGQITIDAEGTSLKTLVVDGCSKYPCEIIISAPSILALTIVGVCNRMQIKLSDVSCLMQATLHVEMMSSGVLSSGDKKILKSVLQMLSHVQKFTLGMGTLQVLSILKHNRARIPRLAHKISEAHLELKEKYIHGLMVLLCCCSDLEKLTLNVIPSSTSQSQPVGLDLDKCFMEKSHLRHLKNVNIRGFVAGSCGSSDEFLLKLVQYLLANAKTLKKLNIHAEGDSKPEKVLKLLQITETLLLFPRISPDAEIVFKSCLS